MIYAEKNYYQLLGVPQTATEDQIKQSFKKLARKYHPDKQSDDSKKEKAQQQFMLMANAYDTLRDPQKREQYDNNLKYGFPGNSNQNQQQQQNFQSKGFNSFNDFFGSFGFGDFFGGGGGGQQRQNHQGGHHHHGGQRQQQQDFGGGGFNFGGDQEGFGGGAGGRRQQRQQQQQENLFEGSKVFEVKNDNIEQFFQRKQVWIFLVYKKSEITQESMQLLNLYKEIAEKDYQSFKFAQVDCQKYQSICEDLKIDSSSTKIVGFPQKGGRNTIKLYSENGYSKKGILDFSQSLIEDLVTQIKTINEYILLSDQLNQKKQRLVILFSDKKQNSPLLKSLALQFENSYGFAEIKKELYSLTKIFKINTFPQIVIIEDFYNFKISDHLIIDQNDGDFKNNINTFLVKYKIKQFQSSIVIQMNENLKNQENFCGKNDTNICVTYIQNSQQNNDSAVIEELEQIAKNQIKKPFRFVFVKSNQQTSNIVLYKGKRGTEYRINGIDMSSLQEAIHNSLDGSLHFEKGHVPLF